MLVGIALLYGGGESLVRGATALARRSGMSPLTIGLTVVALGTSAPELAVTLDGALQGHADLAVGNVVGSNLCNLALVLPLALWIRPLRLDASLRRRDLPVMLGATALLLLWLGDGRMSRLEGALAMPLLLAYGWQLWRTGREGRNTPPAPDLPTRPPLSLRRSVFAASVGLVLLALGGYAMVHGAVGVARAAGMSEAAIGLTVVAVGTSLPEIAATVIAAARRQPELALGNIVGTNVMNVLAVLGTTALARPLPLGDIGWLDLGVLGAVSAWLPLRAWSRGAAARLGRADAVALLLVYLAYGAWRLA